MSALDQLNAFFTHAPLYAIFFHFAICASLGSYFNLFAWRWPQIQERIWLQDIHAFFQEKGWKAPEMAPEALPLISFSKPASFCPHCSTPIKARHNLPVLGWLALRGKGACCGKPISFKYPFFELVCGLIGVFSWLHFGALLPSTVFLVLAMSLCMAAQTDFESMMLPDSVSAFIMFAGLLVSISPAAKISSVSAILGIVIFFAVLEAIRIFGKLAFRKDAMGEGDPKFLAAAGAWLGPLALPEVLLVASISSLAYAVAVHLVRKAQGKQENIMGKPVPFGPFLALGALASYLAPLSIA